MTQATPVSDAEHYREMAARLRELARQCGVARARLELVQLALKFERKADKLDNGLALDPTEA